MSFNWSLYGLQVQANQLIHGLTHSTSPSVPDLQICLGFLPEWLNKTADQAAGHWYVSAHEAEPGVPNLRIWALAGGSFYWLRYADGTDFVVNSIGTKIWSRWPESVSEEDAMSCLLGPVMGFVLLLRGIICLHAGSIAVGGRAIAIAGPSQAGKSTVAAAFAKLGYPVLSEDVVTLDERNGRFLVHPGYARIRLWPDSAEALYGSADVLPRLAPTWDKRYLDLTEFGYRFEESPLPLAAAYILEERALDCSAFRIESLSTKEALLALIGNTYATNLMDKNMRGREFEILRRVIAGVPIRRVFPPNDYDSLPQLCNMIVEDFKNSTESVSHAPSGTAQEVRV
jgi:hypothetical protein